MEILKVFKALRFKFLSRNQRITYYKKEGIKIGENLSIVGKVSFGSEPYLISIGNNVRISNNVNFVTHDGGMHVLRNLGLLENADKFGEIIIEDNVFIGMNSIIMPGVRIGKNTVIGAGSIVTKSIDENTVACGIPAKKIKSIEQYYEDNKDKVVYTKNMSNLEKKLFLMNELNK